MSVGDALTIRPALSLWKSASGGPVAARIAIAGDFLPAGQLSFSAGDGWRDAACGVNGHFDDVDISFVNLECALGVESLPARRLSGLGQIVSAPVAALGYLDSIRSRAVGLANNHIYDFGHAGVECTRSALRRHGMAPLGAGRTLHAAPDVFIWCGPGDVRVGFWAAARASHDLATRKSVGVEPATVARASQAQKEIQSRGARFSIALLHAGCLRTNRPDPAEVDLMDAIAKSEFDIVAASHSHRISGAKLLDSPKASPAFCFYGLGSIVSGYIASPLEREGLIIVAGLNHRGDLANIEVRPVLLGQSGFGEIPSREAATTILERFRRLSDEIEDGSAKRLFYDDLSRGIVQLYLRDARAAFRESGIRGLAQKAGRARLRHLRRLTRGRF
jgi:hypothetical protein